MRHWALLIGINQYRFFQPLNYAQQDAQALRTFLIDESGFSPEQCLLLTDLSPPIQGQSTFPDRETILNWVDVLIQQYVQSGDVLWCFFSGYGVSVQGVEYLMPIAGNAADPQTTAISAEEIFSHLKALPASVVMLLDVNRLPTNSLDEAVGAQIAQLAERFKIPTILSCRPGQLGRESAILGHGFFTTALLEGLRLHQTATLADLDQYLNMRLPELSEHYWRPIQQPLTIAPPETLHQPILPLFNAAIFHSNGISESSSNQSSDRNSSLAAMNASAGALNHAASSQMSASPNGMAGPVSFFNSAGVSEPTTATGAASANGVSNFDRSAHPVTATAAYGQTDGNGVRQAISSGQSAQNGTSNGNGAIGQSAPSSTSPNTQEAEEKEIPDALFWRPLLLWGGVVVLALLLGVLVRNWASFIPRPQPDSSASADLTPSGSAPTVSPLPIQPTPNQSISPINQPSDNQPTTPAQSASVPGEAALDTPAQSQSNLQQETPKNSVSTPEPVSAPAQLAQPQPAPVQSPIAAPGLPAAVRPSGKAVASPLDRARAKTMVKSQYASSFWYAIREANKIPPGHPQYQQAQREIASWSQDIWTIAKQRSNEGFYDMAILAARLVPQNQPMYRDAQVAIERWCPSFRVQPPGNPVQQQQVRGICSRFTGGW